MTGIVGAYVNTLIPFWPLFDKTILPRYARKLLKEKKCVVCFHFNSTGARIEYHFMNFINV